MSVKGTVAPNIYVYTYTYIYIHMERLSFNGRQQTRSDKLCGGLYGRKIMKRGCR